MAHRLLVLCHVLLLVSVFQNNSFGQDSNSSSAIASLLSSEGFENVVTKNDETGLIVAFENRRYRFQARGLAEVVKIISQSGYLNSNSMVYMILLHQNVPMVLVNFKLGDYQDYIKDSIGNTDFAEGLKMSDDYESAWAKISSEKSLNHSNYKSELQIIPQIKMQLGDFKNPVDYNFDLIPAYNFQISKGLSLNAQVIIPVLHNQYVRTDTVDSIGYSQAHQQVKEKNMIRPGIISINQFVRLADDVFLNTAIGFFDMNRAGVNFEMKKYFLNGRLSIGANLGYTADYTYTGKPTEYLVDQNYLTALFTSEYRYEPYDLTGRLQAGNFLYNQLGVRCDLLRQFGEASIGFFVLATQDDLNGGFNFTIPIPPRKYSKPKYLRIRPADNFFYEYRAKGYSTSGTMYNTDNELFKTMSEYNPDYLKRNFLLQIKKYYYF